MENTISIWELNYNKIPKPSAYTVKKLEEASYICPLRAAQSQIRENWYKRRWAVLKIINNLGIGGSHKPFLIPNKKTKILKNNGELSSFLSISHSKSHFVVAISKFYDIGIDTEFMKPIELTENLKKLVYHKNEYSLLDHKDSNQSELMFYKTWTLKEAYLKISGFGLFQNMALINSADIISTHTVHRWFSSNNITTICFKSDKVPDYAFYTDNTINWE